MIISIETNVCCPLVSLEVQFITQTFTSTHPPTQSTEHRLSPHWQSAITAHAILLPSPSFSTHCLWGSIKTPGAPSPRHANGHLASPKQTKWCNRQSDVWARTPEKSNLTCSRLFSSFHHTHHGWNPVMDEWIMLFAHGPIADVWIEKKKVRMTLCSSRVSVWHWEGSTEEHISHSITAH